MTNRVDCVVIGAGVIGLCIARRLAMTGVEVIVLEAAATAGTQTSSRNSEVSHAGIYYPAASLKARLCVAGKHALYAYCQARGVEHRRCGKLIVATSEQQIAALELLQNQAGANGVADLQWRTPGEVSGMEPAVFCVAALWSPSSGIIDSHGLMLAYQGEAEAAGAMFSFRAPVSGGRIEDDGILLSVGGDHALDIKADWVINAAGLSAQKVAAGLHGLAPRFVPPVHYAKGNYFALSGKPPFTRLVYPLAEQAGLGVHATIDLAGQVRFGPDVEWVDHIDYSVDPARAATFYSAVRKYYPALADGALQPAYCGIRPKLQAPGEAARDFMIQGAAEHGIDGLVNLYGIESPGLTASLAIADRVADMLLVP
jgi:L-2-hydroxyglutarate oxidase LhgO